MKFELISTDGGARRGRLVTGHGSVETPVFMPCGTQATVKSLDPRDLHAEGCELLLSNTYHLALRPGSDVIRERGGLHRFMGWDRGILTDSGGYQVLSLAALRRIEEEGVRFQSHLDGSARFLSPEGAVDTQLDLGVDILMALDECPPHDAHRDYQLTSLDRTARWAGRCRSRHPLDEPGLFGIVQGGTHPDLRARSAGLTVEIGFEGYAIGGLGIGEPANVRYDVTAHTAALLPVDRPRYLMGVGTPQDLLECMGRGVDMFDCVLPTRNARTGTLFTSQGRVNIKGAAYARDDRPLDAGCACYACGHFSRAYLRHLYVAGELLGLRLNTIHNLHYYLDLMRQARAAIEAGTFPAWKAERLAGLRGDSPPLSTRQETDRDD
jgi:queuine tRNA-ribosyltransferase